MKKIFFVILVFVSTQVFAENFSMRNCMILPITDTVGNSFSYKVYEGVEKYLKEAGWCDYKSSANIINIFSKYRDRLPEYLQDPSVIKTVAERLRVGTILRIKLSLDIDQVNLSLDVIGENGSDIYFSEKTVINKIETYPTLNTLKNWLEIYEASIPYDGKVLGVLGDQITFSVPKSKRIAIGQDFIVKRLKQKNKHPLLKKIVEWDSVRMGKGKIFNISKGQALGTIKVYTLDKSVEAGDWIRLEKYDPRKVLENKDFSKYDKHKFGRLGDLALTFTLSNHTISTNARNDSIRMNGLVYGISAEAEMWITRQYFVSGEFSRKVGNADSASGSPDKGTTAQNSGVMKIAGGFKYLPMGHFYGPQVNVYTGWAKYSYQLDESPDDGFGAGSIDGIILGVSGNIPLEKGIRLFGGGEIIPFAEFNDDDNIFGSSKSISSLVLEIGGTYQWSGGLRLVSSLEIINNSAKFSGSNSELKYSDTTLKLGGIFSF